MPFNCRSMTNTFKYDNCFTSRVKLHLVDFNTQTLRKYQGILGDLAAEASRTLCLSYKAPTTYCLFDKLPSTPHERHPQLSLATRGEDWASQGQPKGKADESGGVDRK